MHRKTVVPTHVMKDPDNLTGDMSLSITTAPTSIEYIDRALLTIVCTGTPTGTIEVQCSNNYNEMSKVGTWFALDLSLTQPTGSPETYIIEMTQTAIRHLRVTYTASSGSGTMTATISGKES